jgi:hypothetical protein
MIQGWVSFLAIMLIDYYSAKRCAQIRFMKLHAGYTSSTIGTPSICHI